MSYIPCSANCRYQKDGLCDLNYAGAVSAANGSNDNGCLHYVPRNSVLRSAQFHGAHRRYSIPESVSDLGFPPDDRRGVLE